MLSALARAENPIVPDVGLNDPHIHIINGKAYVYAIHEKSIENENFIMEDWWIWSSTDLVQGGSSLPLCNRATVQLPNPGFGARKLEPDRAGSRHRCSLLQSPARQEA